jgi:CHAD domain-containing protein
LFDEYSREILGRQEESWQAPSPEAFHQLRVYIKRMRALLGLVEELSGSDALRKRRKVFRGTFKAAGRVRDLHVQIDLVRDVESRGDCPVPWYRERLEQQEREAVESFLCRHDGMLTTGDIAAVRTAVDKALAKRSSVELSAQAWRHFESCLARTIAFDVQSKDLHDLRKRTKEASNLTWILERVFPEVSLDQKVKEMLDDLQNQLGKWHDYDVAVVWEKSVRPDEVPCSCRENWRRFVIALRRKRGSLRTRVIRMWKKLAAFREVRA